jgi:hypothetical protein
MLNGSRLNQAPLNGGASFTLVQAESTWIISAGLTAEGSVQLGASATIDCGVSAIFGGERTVYASWNPVAGAVTNFKSNTIRAGKGTWTSTGVWQALLLKLVNAEAGFDTSSQLEIVPGATYVTAAWTADAVFDSVPTLTGALKGTWENTSELTSVADVTRMMEGSWEGGTSLWVEPTTTVNGEVFHEGYVFLKQEVTWENVPYLTAPFTNGTFQQGTANWSANAFADYSGKGIWTGGTSLEILPSAITFATVTMEAGSVLTVSSMYSGNPQAAFTVDNLFEAEANVSHAAKTSFTGSTQFTAEARKQGALKANLQGEAVLISDGLRSVLPVQNLQITTALLNSPQIVRNASVAWIGTVSTLISAASLSASPAPAERRFKITGSARHFGIGRDFRKFKVAA